MAITFDAISTLQTGPFGQPAGPISSTFAYTVGAGTFPFLVVATLRSRVAPGVDDQEVISGVTYGGVSLTRINSLEFGDGVFGYQFTELWVLFGPVSGTPQNVVISGTAFVTNSAPWDYYVVSYLGVQFIDNQHVVSGGSTAVENGGTGSNSATVHSATIANQINSTWTIGVYSNFAIGWGGIVDPPGFVSATSGFTLRSAGAVGQPVQLIDSGVTKPLPGTTTFGWTQTPDDSFGILLLSISDIVPSGYPSPAPTPAVTRVSSVAGSMTIEIGGTGFSQGASVGISGGVGISNVVVVNANLIVITITSPVVEGLIIVTVTNPTGSRSAPFTAFVEQQDKWKLQRFDIRLSPEENVT